MTETQDNTIHEIDYEGYQFTYIKHDGIMVLHNDYGPAVVHPDGYFAWYEFGRRRSFGFKNV